MEGLLAMTDEVQEISLLAGVWGCPVETQDFASLHDDRNIVGRPGGLDIYRPHDVGAQRVVPSSGLPDQVGQ